MTSLLTRLDEVASPMVGQIVKYTGLTEQNAKVVAGVLGAGVGVTALWKLFGTRYNLPPGPRPLPLLGNVLNLGKNPKIYMNFVELGEKYGDVVCFYLGPYRTILLNSAEAVRQAFIKDDLAYADRQDFASLDVMTDGGKDIIGAPFCPRLQQQRKLALAALRKYASGSALEHHVEFAFESMRTEVDKAGQFMPYNMGYLVAYNIISSMCFGRKFEFGDPFMTEMMASQAAFEEAGNSPATFFYLMPMMKYFPSKVMRVVHRFDRNMRQFLQECMESHLETYDPNKLSDFTYHLIHLWKESEKDTNERSKTKLLDQDNFRLTLFDLFLAGTDTTRQTLAWIWYYLAAFPEIQQKAQKEIDDIIGDGPVTVDAREQLPYVDAVIHEVMRIRPVVPTGVARKTRMDTKLFGYDVPKGTMVMNNTWAVHYDERVWENPAAFTPERWLDENGKYVFQSNGFLPFSVGRRSCIGESFAKLEIHMLTTLVLQKYNLKPKPGHRINLDTVDGFAVRAAHQTVVAEKRNK